MSRRVLALAFVVSVGTLLPVARAEAVPCLDFSSPTCMPVAQFEWAEVDIFGFGDPDSFEPVLTLINISDTDPAFAAFADDLTDIVVWVDIGGGLVDLATLGSFVTSLASGAQIDTGLISLFGLQSAAVDFVFRGVTFSSALTAMTLTGDGAVRIGFETAPPASVPEPTALLLMGLGVGGAMLRRRRQPTS